MGKNEGAGRKRAPAPSSGKTGPGKKKKVDEIPDTTEDEGGKETADKGVIQNIINKLKYRSDPEKNKKGKDVEEAAKLLEHYREIKTSGDRALFAQKFQELGVIKFAEKLGLVDNVEDYDDKKEAINVNYKNWRYIFKAEGLDPGDYQADEEEGGELDQMLHKLLIRNAKENGYEKGMKPGDEDETDRDLVRWLYVDNKGTDFTKAIGIPSSSPKKVKATFTRARRRKRWLT